MLDNSGADADLYRKNRDVQMLPTTEQHLAQVGTELTQGDFRRNRQVCKSLASHKTCSCYVNVLEAAQVDCV